MTQLMQQQSRRRRCARTCNYVEVKSAEHQARAVAFRTHQCFVRQPTQLINALRGHLGEFGIVVAQGPANLAAVAGIFADETNDLPEDVREIGRLYLDQIGLLTGKIDGLMLKLREAIRRMKICADSAPFPALDL
jgi:transposase